MTRRSIPRTIAAACLLTLLPLTLAWAGVEPTPFRTGLFGVTAGQSIRISVVNAGEARGVINPCDRVWDAVGTLLFETDGGPLPAGVGTFVDFVPPPSGTLARVQVRAEAIFAPIPDDGAPDPAAGRAIPRQEVLLTLEVFDTTTGKTAYTMPYSALGLNPRPESPEPGDRAQ